MKKRSKLLLIILILIILAPSLTIAGEIKIKNDSADEDEKQKKIKEFFINNPFPDAAYEIHVNETVKLRKEEDGTYLDIIMTIKPKQVFWESLKNLLSQISSNAPATVPSSIQKGRDILDGLVSLFGPHGEKQNKSEDTEKVKEHSVMLYGERYNMTAKLKEIIKVNFSENFDILAEALSIRLYGHHLALKFELTDVSGKLLQQLKTVETGTVVECGACGTDACPPDNYYSFCFNLDCYYKPRICGEKVKNSEIHYPIKLTEAAPEAVKKIEAFIVVAALAKEIEQKKAEEKAQRQAMQEKKKEEERKHSAEIKEVIEKRSGELLSNFMQKCGGSILSLSEFMLGKNPIADKGKCTLIQATTMQMTSEKSGLFQLGNEVLYLEFPDVFRGPYVRGVAKVKGNYTYPARLGGFNTVPHLAIIESLSDSDYSLLEKAVERK